MIALVFVLFVLYTLACILDGPDIRPMWENSVRKRYIYLEHYNRKKDIWWRYSARLGKWRAGDHVGEIKDEVHVLPNLSYYYNSSEYMIRFSWLVFDTWFVRTDFRKHRIS